MPFIIDWVEPGNAPEQSSKIPTPGGWLLVRHRQEVICATDWEEHDTPQINASPDFYANKLIQLVAQFCQNPEQLYPIKLAYQGSVYRHRVWQALGNIPFGTTATYADIAKQIHSAPRAVGNACRDNPYAFFIPCHRVVSASGTGGYCGQTLGELIAVKQKLLRFEAGDLK